VEERQRQKLSAVIAETDRRVEAEPDLDKRAAILEEALKLYPGESHFGRAMRLVRDKRDLVNSIVAKARFFEDRGQFNEALDQWQILKSIHDQQPGLVFEIQRLMQRRDQQAHENTKARWVEQADKYLEGGDYERAMQTVESALAEFPGEAELLELEKLVRKNRERGFQALACLDRARELGEKHAPEQALDALREGYQLDPRNVVIRTVLMNSLLDRARRLVDSEWEAADGAVREVLELEPKHALAQSLASRIADRKRDDFIAWCLSQSRRLQTEGDIDGALAVAGQGLGAYPNEPRLQQLQATLQRAKVEADRQLTRPRDPLEAAQLLKQDAVEKAPPPVAPPAGLPTPPPEPAAPAPPRVATEKPGPAVAPPFSFPLPAGEETIPFPAPPAPPPAGPPPSPQAPVPPWRRVLAAGWTPAYRKSVLQGAVAFMGVLLVVIAGVAIARRHKPEASAIAGKFKVRVMASPAAAEIEVNGKPCGASACEVELGAGSYLAEARLDGYRPASANFTVGTDQSPSSSSPVVLTLQPLMPRLAISTDLAEGSIQVDGAAARPIQGGAAETSDLTAGTHEIAVKGGNSAASFTLQIAAGQIPSLAGPIQATNLRAFVLAAAGSEAHLYGSMAGFQAKLDGKSAGNPGAGSLEFRDLAAGSHELILDGPTGQHDKMVFESQPTGAVYASLLTGANMGVLNIAASEDHADVFINGNYQRGTEHGHLLVYLPPRKYTVRVQKDGFTPIERVVELHAFQEIKAEFVLAAQKAVLVVQHTPPGSEVLLDGNRIGSTGADGEFSATGLEAGKHSVEVRHDQFKPLESEQTFAPGKTVAIEGALESLLGTLRIDVNPADAHVRIRREGEARDREVDGGSASVIEGNYTVTGSAPRYQDGTATVRVAANRTVTATLALKPVANVSAPAPRAFTLEDWRKTAGWTLDQGVLRRRGGDIVPAPMEFSQAHIRFTIQSVKGKRTEWVLGFRDPSHYWLFQLDNKNFIRTMVAGGSRSDQVKKPHGLDRKGDIGINIDITPSGIVHSVLREREWVAIDKWDFPEGAVRGKFGFSVPSNDEIALKAFNLTY
jgi:tetratricopeptide (TPR) repeat protein